MDLKKQTQKFCDRYQIKPAGSKGQNFLINENVYQKIIQAGQVKKNDFVLEVGPGLGFLSIKLAPLISKLITVELDDSLAFILKKN